VVIRSDFGLGQRKGGERRGILRTHGRSRDSKVGAQASSCEVFRADTPAGFIWGKALNVLSQNDSTTTTKVSGFANDSFLRRSDRRRPFHLIHCPLQVEERLSKSLDREQDQFKLESRHCLCHPARPEKPQPLSDFEKPCCESRQRRLKVE
jgi:hypothetical protein